MQVVPTWETIPFHFIWVSITILYGFRVWRSDATIAVLIAVMATTGAGIAEDVRRGSQTLAELTEVPLMAAMFAAMVWHARRRLAATRHPVVVGRDGARFAARAQILPRVKAERGSVPHRPRFAPALLFA